MKLFIAICSATLLSFSISALAQSNQSYSKQYSKNPSAQVKAEKVFIFDPRTKKWAAYQNGKKVGSGPANGGKPGYHTPRGTFHIYSKKGPNHVSSKYPVYSNGSRGGAKMPYAMHFTKAGHAIHGSPTISNQNSSHGCIRVKTSAAKWLNESFMTRNTKVIVYPY
ncbi:MAG TPA: L,D-transpeptidase [Coxiellaceae bacterium]|nr:L,D-transpeptidase [Coxiellaceae bacterium]